MRACTQAKLFPGSKFVVGYDTALRMAMPKYYGDSEFNMLLEFARWAARQGLQALLLGAGRGCGVWLEGLVYPIPILLACKFHSPLFQGAIVAPGGGAFQLLARRRGEGTGWR